MLIFTRQLLDELAAKATASPRGRTNFNIHASAADPVKRSSSLQTGSPTFCPHRHLSKSELALVFRGQIELITFDDRGVVTARHVVGGDVDGFAFEMPRAGSWHTLIAREDGALFSKSKRVHTIRQSRLSSHHQAPAEANLPFRSSCNGCERRSRATPSIRSPCPTTLVRTSRCFGARTAPCRSPIAPSTWRTKVKRRRKLWASTTTRRT